MSELREAIAGLNMLPMAQRANRLIELVGSADVDQITGDLRDQVVDQVLAVINDNAGTGRERLELGEILGRLGDPRMVLPNDPAYFAAVQSEHGPISMGRFPVTNFEYNVFVQAGGYDDQSLWTDEGWAWLQQCPDPWHVRAQAEVSRPFVVANQPVVGVTFFEALAYANFHKVRLPRRDERMWVMRGPERRPYPWGSPFGEGNANTLEEVLGRPCAVGLFIHDRTPEGVCDLAGNVAEWTMDGVGCEKVFHPGAWDQPSLASWAKAIESEAPDARWAGLGFRLARD
ncbi:MAG: SUMF1/EgtB/PvdO family nonheme iron enzyme [Proteobacteria bacterium]|nr:SUMF1/EgtB/PvdO family nonheme iron enzyme [Pseudomonadota bacterium]